jgi:hypothetical protein
VYKLIDYITESENTELRKVDKKILSFIHNKVWKKHANDDRIKYDVVEELRNLDESAIFKIHDFLKNIMGFDDIEEIDYYIKLFVNNFQEDGDYNKLTHQSENIIPKPNDKHLAVAESLNLPRTLVMDKKESWDRDMSVFYDIVNDDHYQVGTEEETLGAINDALQDRYYNFQEAAQFEGTVNGLISYLFIEDADKRIIAGEYAESAESSNDISKVIRMFLDYEYTEEDRLLLQKYNQLRDKEGHDPTAYRYVSGKLKMGSGIPPTVEMEDIENSIRERFKELVYDDEYNKMDNYIGDWLMEHGYITQDQGFSDYEFTKPYLNKWNEVDVSKLPKWLNFDRDEFIDDMATIDRAGELSNMDDYYDTETINDDTYYIIQIDY